MKLKESHAKKLDWDKPTSSRFDLKRIAKMNLLYQRFWSGNLVVFIAMSLMVYSDHQTDDRGSQNLRENGEERKKMKLLERWWFF